MVPEIDLNFGDFIMNVDKLFYVTLEYSYDYNQQYRYNQEVGQGFKSFNKAVDFAEAVARVTQKYSHRVTNYSVCYK